jgi:glycerophosphoryl diester phosphodiesterase
MFSVTAAAGRLFLPAVTGDATDEPGSGFFEEAKRLDVIAHRGGKGERPGETMLAFKHAVELGVDVLEMDVYRTSDDHLVLIHNSTLNETTDGTGPVSQSTLKQLKQLNAGFHWKGNYDNRLFYRKKLQDVPKEIRSDLTVATLAEVFTAFPHVRMNIEMKSSPLSPVEKLCQLIHEHKMEKKVLVASFWHSYLKEFRRLCPEVATSASAAELINYKLFNKRPDAAAIQISPALEKEVSKRIPNVVLPSLTREFVGKAHKDGLKVHAWTINEIEEMKRIKDIGIDGIITDYPTRLLSVREQQTN